MTIKQVNRSTQLQLAIALLILAITLASCADLPKPLHPPSIAAVSVRTLDQPTTEKNLDLVSILVKFADLNTAELPAEKFERYFKTKVVWTIHLPTGLPGSFDGTAPAYGIAATGSNRISKVIVGQGIWMELPRTGQCILLKDLLPQLPQLKKHPHLGRNIFREDDPSQWESYAAYTIEDGASYVSFRFAFGINSDRIQPEDRQCLREVSAAQYLR